MKQVPEFKNEQEEREFWETHDSKDYVDMSKAKVVVFSNLKKTKWRFINPNKNIIR